MKDLYSNIAVEQMIDPGVYTTTQTSDVINRTNYRSVTILVDIGLTTDGLFDFEVQESDDNATWTAVADDDLLGTEPTVNGAASPSEGLAVHKIGYAGNSKYVRVVATEGASPSPSTGVAFGVTAILGHPALRPTS